MNTATANGIAVDDLLAVARDYVDNHGLQLVPLGEAKTPYHKWWQQLRFSLADVEAELRSGAAQRIGVQMGPASGVIDFEWDTESQRRKFFSLFEDGAPPIGAAFKSSKGEHRLFKWDDRLEATNFGNLYVACDDGSDLIVRIGAAGLGSQSEFPPSGNKRWLPGLSLGECEPATLPESVLQFLLNEAAKKPRNAPKPEVGDVPPWVDGDHDTGDVHRNALKAMLKVKKPDGGDGSKRLLSWCCRAVEFNLTDAEAVATITEGARQKPFPKAWTDAEILTRLRDAELRTTRGKALVVKRSRTDMGNAERFAAMHGADVRYVHKWDKWLVWTGRRWKVDDDGSIERLAKQTAKSIYAEAAVAADDEEEKEILKWATGSQSRARIEAMLALAKSELPIPLGHDSLDSDPWLLNCENGTVDLRTGVLRPHNRGDLLTMTTGIEYPTEPGEDCPLWDEFLETTFNGDRELIAFVQRLAGLGLVGEVLEHILAIFHGHGANGKSVYIETAMAAMGDYAMKAPAGLLMASRGERHPTELADLFGKRLVAITETADGSRLDERLVKETTGGDTIRARRMREDFWQFRPSHLSILVTNYKPRVSGTDYGIWRRLRLVPFEVTIPAKRQDAELPSKLRAELPAILRWMVAGCLAYQRGGLQAPKCVMTATEGYKAESDTFAAWFDECMVQAPDDPEASVKASAVWGSYKAWSEENNERMLSRRSFGERIADRILEKKRSNGWWYVGIKFPGV